MHGGTEMQSSTRWFYDAQAELVYKLLKEGISPTIASLFPDHEFTHMGLHKVERFGEYTGEVIVELRLNLIGSVKVVPQREEIASPHKLLNNK